MAHKSTFLVKFRRRRESKTNYKKRIALLKAKIPRAVVRKHSKNILVQFVDSGKQGDLVKETAHSKELAKFGWKANCGNLPAAYLTGLLAGLRAKQAKIENSALDLGLVSPIHGSVVFSALKGIIDAGVKIAHDESALPKKERIEGKHIEDYAKKLDDAALKKQFGAMIAAGSDPKKISVEFAKAKEDILKNFARKKEEKK